MTIRPSTYLLHYSSGIEAPIRILYLDATKWLHNILIVHAILVFNLRFIRPLGAFIPWEWLAHAP